LHEFVPHDLKGQQEMADAMGVSLQYIQQRVESLKIPVSGTMISGWVSTPSFFSSKAAPRIARVCI